MSCFVGRFNMMYSRVRKDCRSAIRVCEIVLLQGLSSANRVVAGFRISAGQKTEFGGSKAAGFAAINQKYAWPIARKNRMEPMP